MSGVVCGFAAFWTAGLSVALKAIESPRAQAMAMAMVMYGTGLRISEARWASTSLAARAVLGSGGEAQRKRGCVYG